MMHHHGRLMIDQLSLVKHNWSRISDLFIIHDWLFLIYVWMMIDDRYLSSYQVLVVVLLVITPPNAERANDYALSAPGGAVPMPVPATTTTNNNTTVVSFFIIEQQRAPFASSCLFTLTQKFAKSLSSPFL